MKIILAGTIGRSGLGGQAWACLQYLLGLRALGHEVYYLEDCGDTTWVWMWEKEDWTYELDYPANYVNACLAPFGLGDRWIYRTDAGSRGVPLDKFLDICRQADLLILRASPLWKWRKEYELPRQRAFIDVDPGFTQIAIANGDQGLATGIARCERRFTIGRHIGAAGCPIPTVSGPWLKTLPPVFLGEWPFIETAATHFTSIIRWKGFHEANFKGSTYGQRDKEFPKFIDLPKATPHKLRIAMMGTKPEVLESHGWEVVRGEVISKTPGSYRQFIQQSRAEFSVPKHGYVETQGGWFSDRSVCYLASGRPVLIEDTGFWDWLPTRKGLVVFRNLPEAVAGLDDIASDYAAHARAARALAEQVFASEKVLPEFLDAAMN